jgi:hypothetical protein
VITRKRKRTWRKPAIDTVEEARNALRSPRTDTPGHELWRALGFPDTPPESPPMTAAEAHAYQTPHDRLAEAIKARVDGMQRAGGKEVKNDSKTRTGRQKYEAMVAELKRRGVSIDPPYTVARIDQIMQTVRQKLGSASPTPDAFIKYLRRHHKR